MSFSDSETVILLTALVALFLLACRLNAKAAKAPCRILRPAPPHTITITERFRQTDPINSMWSAMGCFPSGSKVAAAPTVRRLEGPHTFEQCRAAAQMHRRSFFALRNGGECLLFTEPSAMSLDGPVLAEETAACNRTETLSPGLEVRLGGEKHHSAYYTVI